MPRVAWHAHCPWASEFPSVIITEVALEASVASVMGGTFLAVPFWNKQTHEEASEELQAPHVWSIQCQFSSATLGL